MKKLITSITNYLIVFTVLLFEFLVNLKLKRIVVVKKFIFRCKYLALLVSFLRAKQRLGRFPSLCIL